MAKTRKRDTSPSCLDTDHRQSKKRELTFRSPTHPSLSPDGTQFLATVQNPVFNGHQDTLPKLPEIHDDSLKDIPFIHQGTLGAKESIDVNMSYERLEFLGDAYLELIATRVIFPRFPKLTAGQLSQKRQLLVRNETLADFSLAYGFDTRARLPKSVQMSSGGTSRKSWTKIMGDIFEAYIAAVILSDPEDGFSTVEIWMTELWAHTLSNKDEGRLNQNAKAQLATNIMGKGIKIMYRDEAEPEVDKKDGKVLFRIGAYLTGWGWENTHLGSGTGWNKNEAGSQAAAQAMSNPLIAQIKAVKREFDARTAEEKKKEILQGRGKDVR